MKKLLALILAALLLAGCTQTYDGPTTTELVVTEYVVRHISPFTDNEWTDREVYFYDIYGNQVRRTEYTDGELTSEYKMTYDENGNMVSRVHWDHTHWIPLPESRTETTYDDRGRVLTRSYYDLWGRETSWSTYTYDDEVNSQTRISDSGSTSTSYFDENGLTIRTISDEYETFYTYDDRGNNTAWHCYADGVLDSWCEIRYDDQDREIGFTRYEGASTVTHETSYVYDDDANTMTRTTSSGTRVEYYDEDGHIHLIEDYNEEGELSLYQQYTYREIRVPAEEATP